MGIKESKEEIIKCKKCGKVLESKEEHWSWDKDDPDHPYCPYCSFEELGLPPPNCKKCGQQIERKDLMIVEEEPWHADCAYQDYTDFLKRADMDNPDFERKISEMPDVDRLRAEAFKRHQEIVAQRMYRAKVNKTDENETENLKKIVCLNEKIRWLEAELKVILKQILVREQKEDLDEVLEKCWCCIKIEGHSGFMHCKNTTCNLYPKLSEFSVLTYGGTLEEFAWEEKQREKEEDALNIMYV